MKSKRVTLANVAAAAGVSRTTASLVLSDRGDELRISEAAQQRVRRVAAELEPPRLRLAAASERLQAGLRDADRVTPEMLAPERETPGMSAIACQKP